MLVSIALSMTLLPAVIALLADNLVNPGFIFRRGAALEPGADGGFWDSITRTRDGATLGVARS